MRICRLPSGQIRLVVRPLHLLADGVGADVILLFQHQPAHFGQMALGVRIVPIARRARPQRVFIQLQPLRLHAAEDHGAQAAVADGQRVGPHDGGLFVPENQAATAAARMRGDAAAAAEMPATNWRRVTICAGLRSQIVPEIVEWFVEVRSHPNTLTRSRFAKRQPVDGGSGSCALFVGCGRRLVPHRLPGRLGRRRISRRRVELSHRHILYEHRFAGVVAGGNGAALE